MLFEKCPVCAGEMVEKEVTEVVRGGGHTATLKVKATVCQRGGERYFPLETVRLFEKIKTKLERQETEDFKPTGRSFEVA
ncbi:MAG: YgiT-type zinc finger protein [Cyanobacteriota bacterium]|nr:YgiT-type zinc finger protein [Cyanobacteriota bacterium]